MKAKLPTTNAIVESASAIAAAIVMHRGCITDEELVAIPLVETEEIANAIRHRLVACYGFQPRIDDDRSRRRGRTQPDSLLSYWNAGICR